MARLTQRQRQLSAARAEMEAALAAVVSQELTALWRRLVPTMRRLDRQRPVVKSATGRRLRKASYNGGAVIWKQFEDRLRAKVQAKITDGTITLNQIHDLWAAEQAGGGYTGLQLDQHALVDAQKDKIATAVKDLTTATRTAVGQAVAEWYETPGLTFGDLVDDLKSVVGETRAARFAATETTRLDSAVVEARMAALGLDEWVWQTRRDEIVCNKCRGHHGKTFHRGDPMPPEASHPNCRCSAVEIVKPDQVIGQVSYQPPPSAPTPVPAPAPVAAPVTASAAPAPSPSNYVPNPTGKKGISFKTFSLFKQKALAGQPFTSEEMDALEAFVAKTYKAPPDWVVKAKQAHQVAPVIPPAPVVPNAIGVKQYTVLATKAQQKHLSPQEMADVEAFSQKTWGKTLTWIEEHKQGVLKPASVTVAKKPKPAAPAQPAPAAPPVPTPPAPQISNDTLKTVSDLHAAYPGWKIDPGLSNNLRYGAVLIDDAGNVLLREPKNHYGNYVWTFAKGGPDYPDEHPVDVIEREVAEETGYEVDIIGFVPGAYGGDTSTTYFVLARPKKHVPGKMDKETVNVQWVKPDQAVGMINQTTTDKGRKRDLAVLQAALQEDGKIRAGQVDYSSVLAAAQPAAPPAQPASKPAPKKKAKPIKPVDLYAPQSGFPSSADGLKTVKQLGGSTGAALVEDPASGQRYVLKRGNNEDHVIEEAVADAVYRAAGANVPACQLYQTQGGTVKLSTYVPNARPLSEVLSKGGKLSTQVKQQLREHFAADALLGNWDVIGMDADNVMVDEQGKVWRIDNGGSLRTRAQGQPKGDAWNPFPTELWTMRGVAPMPGDPVASGAQAQAQQVFGGMSYKEVCDSVRELAKRRDAILAVAPEDVRPMVAERLDNLEHVAKAQENANLGGWVDRYQDEHGRHIMEIRRAGIHSKLPRKLAAKASSSSGLPNPEKIVDEKGKLFDHLRGKDSIVTLVKKHIQNIGGDYSLVTKWMHGQAFSSYSDESMALKWFVTSNKQQKRDDFYFGEGMHFRNRQDALLKAEACYTHLAGGNKEEVYRKSFEAYQAFIYELLTEVDLPNKNSDNSTFRLIRTESSSLVHKAGAKPGAPVDFSRGAAESCSLLVPVLNDDVTVTDVPISNVLGVYLVERNPGHGDSAFYGDHENEFVCCLGKTPWEYLCKKWEYKP